MVSPAGAAGRLGGDGDGAFRCVSRHILWCSLWPGDEFDIFWRIGGAEEKVAKGPFTVTFIPEVASAPVTLGILKLGAVPPDHIRV